MKGRRNFFNHSFFLNSHLQRDCSLPGDILCYANSFLASLVRKNYIWPGLYLEHIKKVVNAIGEKGHSVVVGRGAGFILPSQKRFSVRTVAPFKKRKENIMQEFNTSESQAEERIRKREARRKDYIKKTFNADINDPVMYDLVINTGEISIEDCAEAVKLLYSKKFSIS